MTITSSLRFLYILDDLAYCVALQLTPFFKGNKNVNQRFLGAYHDISFPVKLNYPKILCQLCPVLNSLGLLKLSKTYRSG